ncbi:MAG TPA: response regulator [Ferrovibrio sp.]|uniref:response regulator n=1 Tax=Ferrovibrio sp. TaxID=1917215 RepID=UPI002B4B4F82|nr:response regulator [Ferrovibrio sp.]HLT77442.1 response regulator [Ferrovibrio sp.]
MARILVVEDESLVAVTLCDALQDHGHEVLHAVNGGAALAAMEKQVPDLIVTDYRMPRLNGAELVDAVRQDPRWRDVPVLMVSGYQDPQEGGSRRPGEAFLQKPFTHDSLLAAVNGLLGRPTVAA